MKLFKLSYLKCQNNTKDNDYEGEDEDDNDDDEDDEDDKEDDDLKYVIHPAKTQAKPATSQSLERTLTKNIEILLFFKL